MKDFTVTIPGTNFELSSNSNYRIEGKISKNSPEEYKKAGFTKIPDKFNGSQVKVKFDPDRKIWDTGFYESSPCYLKARVSKEQIQETVEILKKHLIPELEESLPDGALSQKATNNFFDDYSEDINQKVTYNTNTADSFWMLWNAFLDYVIAPEDEQKKPKYNDAMISTPFVIINGTAKRNQEQDNTFAKIKATSTFMSLVSSAKASDKEFLVDVSNYVGFRLGEKTDSKVALSQFDNWITNTQSARQNISQFNDKIEYFQDKKNTSELSIYNEIKKAVKNGIITKDRGGELFLTDESLGNSTKIAAQKVNLNKTLKKTLLEAMA